MQVQTRKKPQLMDKLVAARLMEPNLTRLQLAHRIGTTPAVIADMSSKLRQAGGDVDKAIAIRNEKSRVKSAQDREDARKYRALVEAKQFSSTADA